MPSTFTTNLGVEKIGIGEQDGTWGDSVNDNMDLLDEAICGLSSITLAAAGTSGSPNTITISADGSSSDARHKFIDFVDGGDLGADVYVQLNPNDAEKICYIRNSLSGGRPLYLFQGTWNASRDYILANGVTAVLKFDGQGDASSTVAPVLDTVALDGIQLGNTDTISWDNAAADNTATISLDASDDFIFAIEGTTEMALSSTALDLQNNDLITAGNAVIGGTTIPANIEFRVSDVNVAEGYGFAARSVALFERDGNVAITLLTGNTDTCFIEFADAANQDAGSIEYNHNTDAMAFHTNDTVRMTVDNVSLDVVPAVTISKNAHAAPTPDSGFDYLNHGGMVQMMSKATQTAPASFWLAANGYYDGAWKYRVTSEASQYLVGASGTHVFRTAGSGTADTAITWTDQLTIANNGDITTGTGAVTFGGGAIDFGAGDRTGTGDWTTDFNIKDNTPHYGFESSPLGTNKYYIGANISDGTDGGIQILEGGKIGAGTVRFAISGTGICSLNGSTNVNGQVLKVTQDSIAAPGTSAGQDYLYLGGVGMLMAAKDEAAGGTVNLAHNAYFDGTWKYRTTDEACAINFSAGGDVVVRTAASGTADTAITWTDALYVGNGGVSQFSGAIKIDERAAAFADTAGQGQIWVKNTVPTELWYTDDAGNDYQIGPAAGGGTVTQVDAGNGMDFTSITGSGSVTMGTPGNLDGSSTSAVTATSHTHAITFNEINVATTSDTTTYPVLVGTATAGDKTPLVDSALEFNASTGVLTAGGFSTTGALTCGTFTSTGIDDNATAERVQISDTDIQVGGGATVYTISNETPAGELRLGTSGGAQWTLYDNTHATNPGDMRLSSNGLQLDFDESAGHFDFQTNLITWAYTTEDAPFFNFVATADADTTSAISTLTTSGATTHHIQVDINGTKAWIAVSTNAPS